MKIALISGGNRKDSTSTKLLYFIAGHIREEGHEAEVIELYQTKLPLYSPDDFEADDNVAYLRRSAAEADGIVLATPEYHGSLSGVLKNALDYLGFDQFDGKAVLSVSSAGGAVGVSSLQHLNAIVRNVHGINCPEWISIGGAQREFTFDGEPVSQDVRMRVLKTVGYFLQMAGKLKV